MAKSKSFVRECDVCGREFNASSPNQERCPKCSKKNNGNRKPRYKTEKM